jgi:hypothetical protein
MRGHDLAWRSLHGAELMLWLRSRQASLRPLSKDAVKPRQAGPYRSESGVPWRRRE